MRVTVPHKKGKQEARRIIDQTTDDVMKGIVAGPVQITDQSRSWNGDSMNFGFTARMGPITAPIHGTVEVADTEVIIDIELPAFLKNFLPEERVRSEVQNRVRGLLT
jgi:hypothetical protein